MLECEDAKLEVQLLNVVFPDSNKSADHKKLAKEEAEWFEKKVNEFKTKYPEFTPDYEFLYGTK
jgi:hypothetical protein